MSSWIISHFPDHRCYVEPFGGGASVIANKDPSTVEVYNDQDGDLVHFFETLQERGDELIEWLEQQPYAKDLHEKYGRQFYAGYRPENDIERAGRFYYLRVSQYAGKYQTFSGFRSGKKRNFAKEYYNKVGELWDFQQRFRHVQIENRDYREIIDRFDSPKTLFYCDPPYLQEGDDLYTGGEFNHDIFVDTVNQLEADCVISYTDLPSGLDSWNVKTKEEAQHMSKGHEGADQTRTERLVLNFDPKQTPMFKGPNQSALEAWQ